MAAAAASALLLRLQHRFGQAVVPQILNVGQVSDMCCLPTTVCRTKNPSPNWAVVAKNLSRFHAAAVAQNLTPMAAQILTSKTAVVAQNLTPKTAVVAQNRSPKTIVPPVVALVQYVRVSADSMVFQTTGPVALDLPDPAALVPAHSAALVPATNVEAYYMNRTYHQYMSLHLKIKTEYLDQHQSDMDHASLIVYDATHEPFLVPRGL